MPAIHPRDALIVPHLESLGVSVEVFPWGQTRDWSRYDALILRSCSDYIFDPDAFLTWILDCEKRVPVWNSSVAVRWNAEKTYLYEMERAGNAIIPTELCDGDDVWMVAQKKGWSNIVVKPVVGANGYNVRRYTYAEQPDCQNRVIVQPFYEEVLEEGEWSFVFISGEFSHALIKKPNSGEFRSNRSRGSTIFSADPPERILRCAKQAFASIPFKTLFGRVDGIQRGGVLHLMEIELIDTGLFTDRGQGVPLRCAQAILKQLE